MLVLLGVSQVSGVGRGSSLVLVWSLPAVGKAWLPKLRLIDLFCL